ncbi:MAG: arginine repressor [Lachnospiraceae bacterium]|nr:arginine repressor [Lachnospiraceae bacterium]
MSTKQERQKKIIELITDREITTQEDLAAKLTAAGFDVTQATVSRDIRELHLSKVPMANGGQKYAVIASGADVNDRYRRVLQEGLTGMDEAESILVVKTVSGMAMAVAAALDALDLPQVAGTIAGDDTIMLAIRKKEDLASVRELLRKQL